MDSTRYWRSVLQKRDQYTSVLRDPGNLDVTVPNSDIVKFSIRDERNLKIQDYINSRGSCFLEKSNEAILLSHTKEFTRIQEGDGLIAVNGMLKAECR